jgi:hypothetical protein
MIVSDSGDVIFGSGSTGGAIKGGERAAVGVVWDGSLATVTGISTTFGID